MTLNKITIHWTAGTNKCNSTDLEHYHYLIDGEGNVISGKHKPEDNINCNDGNYAQHCGGGNTGNIGVALCGMAGYNGMQTSTKYHFTQKQCEAMFKQVAVISKKYNIPIDKDHIFTHYEFGLRNMKTSSYGKIDITFMLPYPKENCKTIGDFIRNKVRWYSKHI